MDSFKKEHMTNRYVRSEDMIYSNMNGDVVMMGIEQGKYYAINGIGSRIWELLKNPITLDEIVNIICADYDVDIAICQSDLHTFIEKMCEHRLVLLVKSE